MDSSSPPTTNASLPSLAAGHQRAAWVDSARCLAIYFILWLHVSTGQEWLHQVIPGALCLFFVLAGYFMPPTAGKAAARALKLGLAWALWSLITLAFFLWLKMPYRFTWAAVFGWQGESINTPLWFLRNLALFQLILAGLMALRALPRGNWLALAFLCGFSWADEPAQHLGLRFDWLIAVLFGFCMKVCPLASIRLYLRRHAAALVAAVLLLCLQNEWYPAWLHSRGIEDYSCSLPLAPLGIALVFCLAGMALERFLPRLNRLLATAGSSLLFVYAAHYILYTPVYRLCWPKEYGWLYALAALVSLTWLCRLLRGFAPRFLRLLLAR